VFAISKYKCYVITVTGKHDIQTLLAKADS